MAKPTPAEIASWTTFPQILAGIEDKSNATNVNCVECKRCTNSKNSNHCEDSTVVVDCTGAVYCNNSFKLTQCKYLKACYECKDCKGKGETAANRSEKLFQCQGCYECNRCIGMVNAVAIENMIGGTLVDAAEFDRVWAIIEADQLAKMAAA